VVLACREAEFLEDRPSSSVMARVVGAGLGRQRRQVIINLFSINCVWWVVLGEKPCGRPAGEGLDCGSWRLPGMLPGGSLEFLLIRSVDLVDLVSLYLKIIISEQMWGENVRHGRVV
jgi:hypothetical protein